MSDKVFNIIIKLTKQGGADKDVVSGLTSIKSGLTAGAAAAGTLVAAWVAVDKVLKATVGYLVNTTTEVEKFRNETGMSAEDSSRLLKVLDDLEISATDVGTAFKIAEKNGFQPTIQSLEAMQAQYQALNPGMERTQFLVKEFGKSGLNMQKFFETGDIAQRLEEVNQALLISDDNIKSVQQYKDSLNEIHNAWEALKISGGKTILPIVVSITKATVDEMKADQAYSDGVRANAAVQRQAFGNRQEGVYGVTKAVITQANALDNLATLEMKAANADKDLLFLTGQQTGAINDLGDALVDVGNQFSAMTDFGQNYDKFVKDSTALEADLAAARKQGYSETSQQITDIKQKLADLQAEQDKQTASWMLNIMTQQLSVDGLSQTEVQYLLDYQVQTGLLSKEGEQRALDAWNSAKAITDAIDSIPAGKTVDIYYVEHGNLPGAERPPSIGPGTTVSPKAVGGPFTGWAMVGDAPGGRMTPYTEYVYAPGGGMVYNQQQMAGRSAPSMAEGGMIVGNSDQTAMLQSIQRALDKLPRDLAAALKHELSQFL